MNSSQMKLITFIAASLVIIMSFSAATNYNQYKKNYNKAMSQMENGKYNEAISSFRDLSNSFIGKKYSKELEREMNKAEASKHNKALYDDGLRFFSEGRYVEAIESLKKVSEDDVDRYTLARQKIDECKNLYSFTNIENAKHAAKTYYYEEAVKFLEQVLACDKDNKEASTLMEEYKKTWEAASEMGKSYGFLAIVNDNSVMIARCLSGEKNITVPEKIDDKSVVVIGPEAFRGYTDLISVSLPKSITTIESGAFNICQSLQSITIPKNVQKIGSGTFLYCKSLMYIYVDPENQYFSEIDGVLFSKDKSVLIAYPEGKTKESYTIPSSVKRLDSTAFGSYCMNLKTIIIPSTVTEFPGNNIFTVPEEVTLRVKEGSAAENYAKMYGLKYEFY